MRPWTTQYPKPSLLEEAQHSCATDCVLRVDQHAASRRGLGFADRPGDCPAVQARRPRIRLEIMIEQDTNEFVTPQNPDGRTSGSSPDAPHLGRNTGLNFRRPLRVVFNQED